MAAVLFTAVLISLAFVATARSASVAYLDGNEVWVASTDGTIKARLSAGEGDWRAVAQSDQGFIVGIRLEAGKISNLSSFTVWNPAGARIHFGPLAGNSAGSSAYPLSLDITPDGGLLIYGYSQYIAFPISTLNLGHYLLPSATTSAPVPEPYNNSNARWPTLIGERVVGTPDYDLLSLQDTSGTGSTTFVPWADFSAVAGADLHRTDVAATGTVFASELDYTGPPEVQKIAVIRAASLGGALLPGDCFLNAAADARHPSFSQDGSLLGWSDSGGVHVGGVPDFSGADPCVLTKAPVTISATGSYPSLGPFNPVTAINAAKPAVTVPKSVKLKALLKSGLTLKIASRDGGKATIKLTVKPKAVGKLGKKPIVIGTAKATIPAGGVVRKVKLKLNRKGKSLKKKLKGKTATISVTIGGDTTTKSIKLK